MDIQTDIRKNVIKKRKLSEVQILAIGFIIVILVGGMILSLPISSASGEPTSFLDAVFTATSATCVTGLVVVDTGTHWNMFGQTVIMILIEIGGLGFMSFAAFITVLMGRKITLKSRLLMQEAMNTFGIQGIVKMMLKIMHFAFVIQLVGVLILSTQFIPEYGLGKGLFYSLFHSISTFCNAGFDIFGNFSSYTIYYNNPVILLTVSSLIAIGGLGFTVLVELYNFRRDKKLSLHSKVVLYITGILILGGALCFFIMEYNNSETMKAMSLGDKIVNSIVASISPRTAGINSISTTAMTTSGKFLTVILMFIGGSPGSTAGGIKTSTLGIVLGGIICVIKGREDVELFQKRIPKDLVYRAVAIIGIAMCLVCVVTMFLTVTEPGHDFLALLYETTSAFGTVGLSLGVTPTLSGAGKIIIMTLMYLGRVGPLTVVLALLNRKTAGNIKYAEGKVLIG
ncbi:TrkH family potassium uptake protein [Clostridium culturomicium]|uniref:TrkH family potassium uptake protein n=1 Tax=Clostridium culturomicium TaxID=1499683 RepID=UPI000B088E04